MLGCRQHLTVRWLLPSVKQLQQWDAQMFELCREETQRLIEKEWGQRRRDEDEESVCTALTLTDRHLFIITAAALFSSTNNHILLFFPQKKQQFSCGGKFTFQFFVCLPKTLFSVRDTKFFLLLFLPFYLYLMLLLSLPISAPPPCFKYFTEIYRTPPDGKLMDILFIKDLFFSAQQH